MKNFAEIIAEVECSGVKGIVFDLYGTLLSKPRHLNAYKSLYRRLQEHGQCDTALLSAFMTQPLSVEDAIARSGIDLPLVQRELLYEELALEIEGIAPYSDSQHLIDVMKGLGLKVAVCSNLALPYEQVALDNLSGIDAWVMSFRVGCKKPDPRIYALTQQALALSASDLLMVGDSLANDVIGPKVCGMKAIQIVR
jgi:HAD superfamily hydrolase (TIGR01549 family)